MDVPSVWVPNNVWADEFIGVPGKSGSVADEEFTVRGFSSPPSTASLPDELGIRELRRIDPDDVDAVVGFINRWGTLTPPWGNPFALLPAGTGFVVVPFPPGEEPLTPSVPFSILSRHVRGLQAVIAHWYAYLLDDVDGITDAWSSRGLAEVTTEAEAWTMFSDYVSAALAPLSPRLEVAGPALRHGAQPPVTAYTAMMVQIRNDISMEAAWRVCENEPCGRLFARQQGRAEAGQFRSSGVLYCTKECARAENQRRYRRRQAAAKRGKEATSDG